jgi:hypothetical protein
MAAHHSLSIDEEACSHYYHCTLSEVPFQCTIQQIAELIVPNPQDPSVAKLDALGCRIVPHKLYTYKETLPRKIGYLTYYIHHKSDGSRDDEAIHHLFLAWLEVELPARMAACGPSQTMRVQLAQPKTCYVAGAFLRELNATSEFLSPVQCKDPRKMETYLLGKVTWATNDPANRGAVQEAETPASTAELRIEIVHQKRLPDEPWGIVGSLNVTQLGIEDVAWLRKEHHGCHAATAAVFDSAASREDEKLEALKSFLAQALAPLFTVQ